MEENLGEIIFDIMTNEYKDKVDKNKDIVDYLKDNTKNELLSLYLLYSDIIFKALSKSFSIA